MINRKEETQYVVNAPVSAGGATNLGAYVAFTSGITSTNECYNLIPQVPQGNDDFQRKGSQIQPVSLTVKGNVTLRSTNLASESMYVDIYFLTAKAVKDQANQAQIPIGQLLNYGNGTNGPYSGTSYIAASPINKSQFVQLRHLRIKLQKGQNDPNAALTGSGAALSSTDAFSYNKTFSVSIPLPAKFLYQAAADIYPSNYYPFMVVGFHGTDQTGDTAPINPRVLVQAQSQLYYKDA